MNRYFNSPFFWFGISMLIVWFSNKEIIYLILAFSQILTAIALTEDDEDDEKKDS